MIRMIGVCVLLIFAGSALAAQPKDDQVRKIVKADSRIEFHASGTFTKVVGVFQSWGADLKMPTDNFSDASLDLQIDAASVQTGSGLKDKEIKGKKFFDVIDHPDIRFVSKGVTPGSELSTFLMKGELTLRGITNPVSVSFKLLPLENQRLIFEGDFSFNRRTFGMTHNVPFNKIADTIKVHFHFVVENGAATVAQN